VTAIWSIRQFACIDAQGKVVTEPTSKKGVGNALVVGWRVRWDAPGSPGRSRTFSKAKYSTPTAAHTEAQEFVDLLRTASKGDWLADERGRLLLPTSTAPSHGVDDEQFPTVPLEVLGKTRVAARGGQPKTVQQHEHALAFALKRLPEGILADTVTSTQCQELLLARRFTPGIKARKLVRMGILEADDEGARMCSVRAEKLFVQDLTSIFAFGAASKPAAVSGNPMLQAARSCPQRLVSPRPLSHERPGLAGPSAPAYLSFCHLDAGQSRAPLPGMVATYSALSKSHVGCSWRVWRRS
jgi:hypothetical protein